MPAYAQTLDGIIGAVTSSILNPFIGFLVALATVVFIWGVIQFMLNTGDSAGREEGKQHIIWGIVGLVIMISVFGIMNLVGSIFE